MKMRELLLSSVSEPSACCVAGAQWLSGEWKTRFTVKCGWIEVRRRELEVEDEEAARVQIIQDTADIKNDIGAYAKYDRKSLESFEEEGDLTF